MRPLRGSTKKEKHEQRQKLEKFPKKPLHCGKQFFRGFRAFRGQGFPPFFLPSLQGKRLADMQARLFEFPRTRGRTWLLTGFPRRSCAPVSALFDRGNENESAYL
jgi:hypothetical protein